MQLNIVDTEKLDCLRQKAVRDAVQQAMIENLLERARLYLTPGSDTHFDYPGRAESFWLTRQGGHQSLCTVETLAVAWRVTGEERYREAVLRILMTIVDEDFAFRCAGTNYGSPYNTWCDQILDAGLAATSITLSLELLHDILSEDQRRRLDRYFVRIVDYLLEKRQTSCKGPDFPNPASNFPAIGYSGLGALALALGDVLSSERREVAVEYAEKRTMVFLEKCHDGDGAPWEGAGYCSATLSSILPFALSMAARGQRHLIDHAGWGKVASGTLSEMIPATGTINPLNDANDEHHSTSWLFAISSLQKESSPAAAAACGALARKMMRLDTQSPRFAPLDATSHATAHCLIFYDPAAPTALPQGNRAPRCRYFRGRGLVDIRTGWERDDYFVSFICDGSEPQGHAQADRGHFAFHALGESFAIDSGYAMEKIEGSTEVIRWGGTGGAHNLPLINGQMQQMGARAHTRMLHVELDEWAQYASCQAPDAYTNVTEFMRRIVFVPPADGATGYLVVADRVVTEGISGAVLSWLLHTGAKNAIEILSPTAVRLTGHRRGAHCDIHIAADWFGRWKQEQWLDHPRLRFDIQKTAASPILLMLPFAPDVDAPRVELSMGDDSGLGLTIDWGEFRDIIVQTSGRGDESDKAAFSMAGVELEGDFAMVRIRDGRVVRFFGAGIRKLAYDREPLHQSEMPAAFLAR